MKTITAYHAANYFLSRGEKEHKPFTVLKVIKMIYIAHGVHLTLYDAPLFVEAVQAWQYGAVIPSIYHAFKHNGTNTIKKEEHSPNPDSFFDEKKEVKEALEIVWNVYKDFTAGQLISLTHKEDTPWYEVWENRGGKNQFYATIPDGLIKEYYDKKRLEGAESGEK